MYQEFYYDEKFNNGYNLLQHQIMLSQMYIDSEQTIVNNLKDTFSCKASGSSTNFLKINTSTYSMTRTADMISNKLEQACKRIQRVQTSISKNKSKCNRKQMTPSSNGIKNSMTQNYQHQHEKSCYKHENQQNQRSQSQLIALINKLKQQISQKNSKIEELQDQLLNKQNKILNQEQKYLRQQKTLILQINRLKDIINNLNQNKNKQFNQKIEYQRVIDELKVKIWDIETKNKILIQKTSKWNQKQSLISQSIRKYYNKLQQEYVIGKKLSQKSKNDKNLLQCLKNIMQIDQNNDQEEDKQNNPQLSNRTKFMKSDSKYCQQLTQNTYRSSTSNKRKLFSLSDQQNTDQKINKIKILQNHKDFQYQSNEQMYRLILMQASVIQKVVNNY